VLRFLIMKNQPNKHIEFDTGLGLLNLVDEYDKEEDAYFGESEEIKGMKDLKKTYELSQPYVIPKIKPYHVPYRHLVTLVQIGKTWEGMRQILLRTYQIPSDLSSDDDQHLRQRSEHVQNWVDSFAPDEVKFEVQTTSPDIELTSTQQEFLRFFVDQCSKISWSPEEIHNVFYHIAEQQNIPVQLAFKTMYQILLGREKGPRAGYFLSNLERDFVLQRVKEAIK